MRVPIKHYPTINWNPLWSPVKWDWSVPIKHYPTINWNGIRRILNGLANVFQLNTIQRLTET